jgi:hypothetical protein
MIEERELDRECKEAKEAIARENELERRNEAYIYFRRCLRAKAWA